MQVTFLDIDGVLNSMGWVIGHEKHFSNADYLQTNGANLDPHCVQILKHFVTQTFPSKIVLSSSWRGQGSQHELDKWIGGMEGHFDWPDFPIIGVTRRLQGPRYLEIHDWLDRHPEVEDWVVIDDERDAWNENPSPHFHHTNMNAGLTHAIEFWFTLRRTPAMLAAHFPNQKSMEN